MDSMSCLHEDRLPLRTRTLGCLGAWGRASMRKQSRCPQSSRTRIPTCGCSSSWFSMHFVQQQFLFTGHNTLGSVFVQCLASFKNPAVLIVRCNLSFVYYRKHLIEETLNRLNPPPPENDESVSDYIAKINIRSPARCWAKLCYC